MALNDIPKRKSMLVLPFFSTDCVFSIVIILLMLYFSGLFFPGGGAK